MELPQVSYLLHLLRLFSFQHNSFACASISRCPTCEHTLAALQAKVLKLRNPGDIVEKGDWVAVVEAMKMQVILSAPVRLEVSRVLAQPGSAVKKGVLVVYQPRPLGGFLHGYARGMSTLSCESDPMTPAHVFSARGGSPVFGQLSGPISRASSLVTDLH